MQNKRSFYDNFTSSESLNIQTTNTDGPSFSALPLNRICLQSIKLVVVSDSLALLCVFVERLNQRILPS